VRNSSDAYAAAAVVMAALKKGTISAREAVDLLRVVEGLARLSGTVNFMRRREVARAPRGAPPCGEGRRRPRSGRSRGGGGADSAPVGRPRLTTTTPTPLACASLRRATLPTRGRVGASVTFGCVPSPLAGEGQAGGWRFV
jgi:hypothetical protein